MRRKLFIFLTIMLVSALNASAETDGKTKVIAKRALGPIGAAIALVEFALCL